MSDQDPIIRRDRTRPTPSPEGMDNIDRFREAESRFWDESVGTQPQERMIRLPGLGLSVRLLEIGEGAPLLFVHGGPNAASTWAPLVGQLHGFRCLLVDRPGCGLSEAPASPLTSVRAYVAQFVAQLLHTVGLNASGFVASSFGSYAVLAHAIARAEAALPTVHFGCPALVPGSRTPLRFLLQSLPGVGRILLRLEPPSLATAVKAFRQIGHGISIDQGRIPQVGLEWYAALLAYTETRDNDLALFGRIRSRDGLKEEELAQITSPMTFFWGANDPFGGVVVAEALANMIPHAGLEVIEDSGHLPWLDAPESAAQHLRSFLTEHGVVPRST